MPKFWLLVAEVEFTRMAPPVRFSGALAEMRALLVLRPVLSRMSAAKLALMAAVLAMLAESRRVMLPPRMVVVPV